MSDKKETPELKISEALQTLSKKIEKQLKIGEGGVAVLEKDFYESTLPEGLSMADVKRVQEHNKDVFEATAHALANLGLPYLKKHKDIEAVTTGYAIGKDAVDLRFLRSKTTPGFGGGEPKTTYGVLDGKISVNGSAPSKGFFKKLRTYHAELAAAQLA